MSPTTPTISLVLKRSRAAPSPAPILTRLPSGSSLGKNFLTNSWVTLIESAAAQQWNLHGLKVARHNIVDAGVGLVGLGHGMVEQIERNAPAIFVQRKRHCPRHTAHTR